ncbi:VOC family protein [Mycobacterium sp. URHB0044]|jgi:glyoxylase I family protein|uniref:VOC family protein n=1 Tax=Mycobacterium sp. URHB0044 TaxID=1380386 RepID=UPI00048AFB3E|nr:VOC family protein [Mycobacterium sp. URHB0044]
MSEVAVPGIAGIHHISITVTDLEASVGWYERLLGANRVPTAFPHYECEDTGYAELLIEPRSGVVIGLHTNTGNDGRQFDEARTGLDHVAFNVATRDELEAWTTRLDQLGIAHSGIREVAEPFAFATVVFRDPDNIQLELFALG